MRAFAALLGYLLAARSAASNVQGMASGWAQADYFKGWAIGHDEHARLKSMKCD
jgi:hypothetical protein